MLDLQGCGGIFDDASIIDDQWRFRFRAEPDCSEHTGPVVFDEWVRFEMLVYWTTGVDGYIRLWQDGELVQSLDGLRTLFTTFEAGTCDMYWALGIYSQWSGSKDHLELFLDDIRISDETASSPASSSGGSSMGGGSAIDSGSGGGGADTSDMMTEDEGRAAHDSDGCSCRTARGTRASWGAWVALLFAGGVYGRRRWRLTAPG